MNRVTAYLAFAVVATISAPLATIAAPHDSVVQAEQARVEVMRRASATTVAIFDNSGEGGGSGVVISADGYALTNFHVTAPCGPAMKCGMSDGNVYDAVIVGIDPVGDVALIQLLGREDFPAAELGDSDAVEVGDWVFTAGNPFLLANDLQPSVAYGMISGTHRYQYPSGTLLEYADCLQTDAAINPGNSGGPLFAADGKLIGINGRGSFEKRGRVNVGVGYAISINQIKHFLGHLKSGRIVDHATLGATVSTTEDGLVKVDEILDDCDAYRRGLRYGDQLIQFAGRPITTANRLKNALGIFPRGWPVPLVYRRDGQNVQTVVRLTGVHDPTQLYDLVQQQPFKPPRPDKQPDPDEDETPQPKLPNFSQLLKKKPKLPTAVANRFEARRGYANYWYNIRQQELLWKNYPGREALSVAGKRWRIVGDAATIDIAPLKARIDQPNAVSVANFEGDLSSQLSPPGSGGLLMTLHLWQRLLEKGLRKYGEVYYLGQLPDRETASPVDCLIGVYAGMETCFQFDPDSGHLVGIVMLPRDGVDPCDLRLSDYREIAGQQLPGTWKVFHGDELFMHMNVEEWELTANAGDTN
ncbi:MAG: trypsin-like peptidase domain-containing protein [Planctomycetota bacterium]